MKISIITVAFNSAETIKDTIESVLNQTYEQIEYIIIDGQSKDQTVNIIKSYEKKFAQRLKWLSEPDKGIYDAMNKGIRWASGDVIGILNSDDYYIDQDVINQVIDIFKKQKADSVYGNLNYVKKNKQVVRKWIAGDYNKNKFRFGWMPPHPTFFTTKKIYEEFGSFRTDMSISNDYEFMLRVLYREKTKCVFLDKFLTNMRVGGHSRFTLKKKYLSMKEDYLAWKVNNLKVSIFTIMLKPIRKINQYFL